MIIMITLFVFSGISTGPPDPSIHEVRALFDQATKEKTACYELIRQLESCHSIHNPVFAGYLACATMMRAKYAFNPLRKLTYFSKGKDMLQKCLEANPQHVELRFLRFTIQCNAPAFLGYHDHIPDDQTFLLQSIPLLKDQELKKIITDYMILSGRMKADGNECIMPSGSGKPSLHVLKSD
jgi:hypothetical protein